MNKIFTIILAICSLGVFAQQTVEFKSTDALMITADEYIISENARYVLLFHQARSSRGEYKDIALKLNKLGFNSVAIDLRSGDESNFVVNETAKKAKEKKLPASYLEADKDIQAAIIYYFNKSKKPLILFGSSYSASLVLKDAVKNDKILAVVSFSPGEYLTTEGVTLKKLLINFDKPVFAASTAGEFDTMNDMLSEIKSVDKVMFRPQDGGVHGARALWKESDHSKECWLELTMFLSKFKN